MPRCLSPWHRWERGSRSQVPVIRGAVVIATVPVTVARVGSAESARVGIGALRLPRCLSPWHGAGAGELALVPVIRGAVVIATVPVTVAQVGAGKSVSGAGDSGCRGDCHGACHRGTGWERGNWPWCR